MPEKVHRPGDIRPGDLFEDCRFHPCLCYDVSDDEDHIFGISLIDGSTWQCSICGCCLRKLTPAEAWRWKSEGPAMELSLSSGRVIAEVTEDAVQLGIQSEEFGTLGIDSHHYIRFERQKAPSCQYALEHQDGTIARRFQAIDGPITFDRVLSAFLKYLRRDITWQSDFQWESME